MNKHWVLGLIAVATLAGCNRSSEVAVRAVSSVDGAEVGRNQLVVRLLPYDRDELFAQFVAAAERAEPQPPATLMALRDSIAASQTLWREAEVEWNEVYSELRDLSQRMERMNQTSNEYFQAYQRFDDLDAQERRLRRDKDRFFEEFTGLQGRYASQADSFNAVVTTWGDEVFEGYGETVDSILKATRRQELWDTTNTGGYSQFTVAKGQWWIYTRAKLPFDELYWNVPLEVTGGTVDTIILNESNAEVRPIF